MNKYILNIGIIMLALLFFSCNDTKKRPDLSKTKELKEIVYSFNNPPKFRKDGVLLFENKNNDSLVKVDIEIVKTDEERARGLMFRPQMDKLNAMLFIMDEEEYQSFWMRNTIISLDIIYVNSNYEIVDIYKNTQTESDKSLPSAYPAKYVVEANAGFCDEFAINVGDKIKIN